MSDTDDIDDIREQKRRELIERAKSQQENSQPQDNTETEDRTNQAILKQWLTDNARQRLNAVSMAHPDRAQAIEQQLVALAKRGRLQDRITEDQMKQILKKANDSKSQSFDITRR